MIVTGYVNPDMDSIACAISYAKFLENNGKIAVPASYGKMSKEAELVLRKWNIRKPLSPSPLSERIVLVDVSEKNKIHHEIKVENVVEIIDHRKAHGASEFPNARVQIEEVGAAATLIAEKFYPNKIGVDLAALLYSAIVSNTINFKSSVTTARDISMAKWLLKHVSIHENYVIEIFTEKSRIDDLPLTLEIESKKVNLGTESILIFQLELVEVDLFLGENLNQIREAMEEILAKRGLKRGFLTCVDTLEGYTRFFVFDDSLKALLQTALNLEFKGNLAKKEHIILRKEMIPLLKSVK
ncbi:MAG: hypothetical protein GOU98_01440 [Candidatus Altiarchaeota archaeon]|nr:hypothetical protein [Candidatus Altiarchaeota archaeon]